LIVRSINRQSNETTHEPTAKKKKTKPGMANSRIKNKKPTINQITEILRNISILKVN
jgi:hypothetical protein